VAITVGFLAPSGWIVKLAWGPIRRMIFQERQISFVLDDRGSPGEDEKHPGTYSVRGRDPHQDLHGLLTRQRRIGPLSFHKER
jgi:hypothetical protein